MNSEVQIAIEATQVSECVKELERVCTGDGQRLMLYIFAIGIALLVLVKIIRKRRKGILSVLLFLFMQLLFSQTLYAAEETKNVDVTVPSNMSIVFHEDGTTSISEFTISNHMNLPISIRNIHVVAQNDWKLCQPNNCIPVDTKQLELQIEQLCMCEEENIVDIPIDYQTNRTLDIQIRRGAWTKSNASETAFELEFEYELGTREFQLTFDENGSEELVYDQMVNNGSVVELPTLFRVGYEFMGWEDTDGKTYTNTYTMPVKHSSLKAKWREICGHAIYLESDQSLRFVYLSEPLRVGELYDGQSITAMYAIPMESVFRSIYDVIWYDGSMYNKTIIRQVIVEDAIKPRSTAYWFCNMEDCERFDLEKLDTSQVTDMSNMFAWAGYNVKTLEINGLNEWKVSKVRSMKYMFAYMGYNVNELYIDLEKWLVGNVTDMSYMFAYMAYNAYYLDVGILARWEVYRVTDMTRMFCCTGHKANWYVYLSPWDVSNVTAYQDFHYGVTSKIYPPRWVR